MRRCLAGLVELTFNLVFIFWRQGRGRWSGASPGSNPEVWAQRGYEGKRTKNASHADAFKE